MDNKLFKHIPTFDWKDIAWKKLDIRVIEDEYNDITTVLGLDEETGKIYVLHVDYSGV
jgi:hypothetical protein